MKIQSNAGSSLFIFSGVMKRFIALNVLFLLVGNTYAQELSIYWISGGALDSSRARSFHEPKKSPRDLPISTETKLSDNTLQRAEIIATNKDRVAFMLIEKGKVVYQYRNTMVGEHSLIVSYSMAKSITSLLVGNALCSGNIKSLEDKLSDYVAELSSTVYGKSTVKNLLNMASGADASGKDGEPYIGYSSDLRNHNLSYINSLRKYKDSSSLFFIERKPGDTFDYKNVDTAALSLLVEKATNKKIQDWYEETLVSSAGLEGRTAWSLDVDNRAIAHAYFHATQNDWARIALYAMDAYNGRKGSCMEDFMRKGMSEAIPVYRNNDFTSYGYQFWTGIRGVNKESFCMIGYGGQYICIDPRKERALIASSKSSDSSVIDFFRYWINE